MADTIHTRVLVQAAEVQGSTQALATLLRVPESTLLRWMSGRAQMPVQAFLKLVELVSQHELKGGAETGAAPANDAEGLSFTMGRHLAHCARCDGTGFAMEAPGPLKMTSRLVCRACGEPVIHGNLVAQLAQDAVQHSKARTVARTRREAVRQSAQPRRSLADDGGE